jgi:hypothetical protein
VHGGIITQRHNCKYPRERGAVRRGKACFPSSGGKHGLANIVHMVTARLSKTLESTAGAGMAPLLSRAPSGAQHQHAGSLQAPECASLLPMDHCSRRFDLSCQDGRPPATSEEIHTVQTCLSTSRLPASGRCTISNLSQYFLSKIDRSQTIYLII